METFEEITTVEQLPYLEENDFNVRVNSMIDQIRKNKNGAYQGLVIVPEEYPLIFNRELTMLLVRISSS